MVPEMSVIFNQLTLPKAREYTRIIRSDVKCELSLIATCNIKNVQSTTLNSMKLMYYRLLPDVKNCGRVAT
jgi:hypothetical protein